MEDRTLDKAKKLLNLLNNAGTESEAAAASLALQRLLSATGMSMADVEAARNEQREVEKAATDGRSRIDKWERYLAAVIARNYRCETARHVWSDGNRKRYEMVFFGFGEDAEMAAEVFKATRNAALKCFGAFKKQYMQVHIWEFALAGTDFGTARRNSYLFGFVDGIAAAYREQVESDCTLALAVAVPREVSEVVRKATTGRIRSRRSMVSRDDSIRDSGYSDGFGVGAGNRMAATA